MEPCRELKFTSLSEVEKEIERLGLEQPETTGNWTYFQILSHLADTIEDSFKPMDPPAKPVEARTTEVLFKRLQKSGKMKPGYVNPALPQTREHGDVEAAKQRLQKAIQGFRASTHLNHEPALGYLNHEQFEFLHAIHSAMHLGFVKA
ncbi:MAG: DUF1569 domain-containing protein [Leptospirales bacterium]|nr:DUF1569 domain-containing protein [Leptospirales bacterium]